MKNYYRIFGAILSITFLVLIIFFTIGVLAGRFPITYKAEPDKEVYIIRSCGSQNTVEVTKSDFEEYTGIASYYDYDLNRQDQKCRSNDCYSMFHATAASRSLERGSYAKVTNISNGKSVVVRINDYVDNPEVIIDLSSYAFEQLSPLHIGIINVKVEPM